MHIKVYVVQTKNYSYFFLMPVYLSLYNLYLYICLSMWSSHKKLKQLDEVWRDFHWQIVNDVNNNLRYFFKTSFDPLRHLVVVVKVDCWNILSIILDILLYYWWYYIIVISNMHTLEYYTLFSYLKTLARFINLRSL